MIQDHYGRTINYMRISVTDRCNLRCRYCMPREDTGRSPGELLTFDEIARVCRQAAALGIDRFKITGGEPLLRRDCAALVRSLKDIPGTEQVTMTTNGVLLEACLDDLKKAGLDAVNISLDTLDPAGYKAITGRDELQSVLRAVRLASERLPVKINCVVQSGVNEDMPVQLAALAKELPVAVRFIEMMPIGYGRNHRTVPNREIRQRLEAVYGKAVTDETVRGNGPAKYWSLPGFAGAIGFISAIHGKFCSGCNRIRLTAGGDLKPCLCYGDTIPLLPVLRDPSPGGEERIRERILEAVAAKPEMHCFEMRERMTEAKNMMQIGG